MFFPIGHWFNAMNIWKDLIRKIRKIARISAKAKNSKTTTGIICPRCNNSLMEYDELLNLRCKECGYILAESYT